jgi:uncharacterized sulfatase
LENLAFNAAQQNIRKELSDQLKTILIDEQDPRMLGRGDVFDSYPRVSPMRNFPGFKERSTYNPDFQKKDQ